MNTNIREATLQYPPLPFFRIAEGLPDERIEDVKIGDFPIESVSGIHHDESQRKRNIWDDLELFS